MGFGDIHGKARTDPRNPRATGVCDFGGEWCNLADLHKQMEWYGTSLKWTGWLVCAEHLDQPQPQLRPIRLPPDPVPVKNPRPESFVIDNTLQGFTQYVMWAGGQPLNFAVYLETGTGQPIVTNTGEKILIEVGSDGPALLAQLQSITNIPVPGTITGSNGMIAKASTSQTMIAAAATRSYIAIFNPCNVPMFVNIGAASAVAPSMLLGPGNCLFWATAQGGAVPTAAEIDVFCPIPGVPYYAYFSP